MSIGEVLRALRADFPDATISKLRFLEAEGLVEPQRTASGYRKYTPGDLERLRFVLTAQRDHYLPLRVIREQLAALDRGDRSALRPRPALAAVDAAACGGEPDRVDRAALLDRSGLAPAVLDRLESDGLVRAGPGGWYDADALTIATVAAELGRFGIEPRHLRAYRAAADREVGLYAQLVTPLLRQPDPSARARADETVRELLALSARLHAALVRAGLRGTLGR
ncbi:MAG TPA: MerR family transcriptional regulator [Pilimelia sp.]|nr:MerR family transcriptional regulator [Pilimelia sp.]